GLFAVVAALRRGGPALGGAAARRPARLVPGGRRVLHGLVLGGLVPGGVVLSRRLGRRFPGRVRVLGVSGLLGRGRVLGVGRILRGSCVFGRRRLLIRGRLLPCRRAPGAP